ncbi:MAG: MgtC/SapB family protein [Oscillospiraceae bacterium]|nr:MgtC/SapB family protein [Oscillospiraceae bacterium]
MLSVLDPLRGVGFGPLLMKLLLSIACGALIGLERSAKNRPAGFRTHILVCLSGTVAAVTGHYLYLVLHLPADITRLSGQVITGLGFIGAGTIIVT